MGLPARPHRNAESGLPAPKRATVPTDGDVTRAPSVLNGSHAKHLSNGPSGVNPIGTSESAQYRQAEQASGDGNSVDMDRERANFADNAIRYEATLRFVNSGVRTMLTAIRGD